MSKRKHGKTVKAKPALTDVDLRNLWETFAGVLAGQSLDPDAYRGRFHENIILTDSYETNHKIVVDLANRIAIDHEASHIDPGPIRIEMPPPKAVQTQGPNIAPFRQEDLKPAYDQQQLDEKLYEYILERNGQDISLTQASEELGVGREEVDRSIDKLCNVGRLPRPLIPAIQEQTQQCMYCSGDIPLGSKFCIRCGQPQGPQLGMETSSLTGQIDFGTEPPPDHVKTDDTRTRERGLRFDLFRHFSERKIQEHRPADMWLHLRSKKQFASKKPFDRFGAGLKPARPKTCPRCRHILGPSGYCDHCRRYR